MGKDVDFLPAGNVERGPRGQELEAGPCQALAALARQHDIQLGAPVVQMQDVGGSIGELFRTPRGGPPLRRLLLLVQITPPPLAAALLPSVASLAGASPRGGALRSVRWYDMYA